MSGYPDVLRYYMWRFQMHFLISCQTKAESVFNKLDRSLKPKVVLLGFDSNHQVLNFEPESVEYLKPIFADLKQTKQAIHENDPDKDMFYSGPGMQEEMDARNEKEYWRKAVEAALNESVEGQNVTFFVSNAVEINKNTVYIVLTLDKQTYTLHTHLKEQFFNERYRIYRSLLETTVKTYLNECQNELYLPNPGKSLSFNGRSWDEILREAAKELMYTFSSKGKAFQGLHGLYEACQSISIHRYEGKENLGTLIIAPVDHESISFTLQLEEPFELSEHRKTRKMLQSTNEEVGVICNTHMVLGLGTVKPDYDETSESIFYVKFRGIHCWEVWHKDKAILVMNYGVPQFQMEAIGRDRFLSDAKRIFPDITSSEVDNLYRLSIAATKQKNGALLIISDFAEEESKRLSKQCLALKPQKLDDDMLLRLTSIDGGVLIDRQGVAYAYGVILDGVVTTHGDASRGSRYNSAVTYTDHKGFNSRTLIVVVSEDGMVDIIPELRPQIYRRDIEQVLAVLQEQQTNFDRKTFNNAMSWLMARKFYLTDEQVKIVNSVKKEIDSTKFGAIRIVYEDIEANPELNDSYFLD